MGLAPLLAIVIPEQKLSGFDPTRIDVALARFGGSRARRVICAGMRPGGYYAPQYPGDCGLARYLSLLFILPHALEGLCAGTES
jgi:hypothetical protein